MGDADVPCGFPADAAGTIAAVFGAGDESQVIKPAVEFVVVDMVHFEGVFDGYAKDAVGNGPDCAVFEDVDGFSPDAGGGVEVAFVVEPERNRLSGTTMDDLTGFRVADPVTGCVFVPCGIVAGVQAGCSICCGDHT